MLTYLEEHVDILPLLGITSPDKQCGKTTLMRVLIRLVRRYYPVANVTAAFLYRLIEDWHPTFLLDEADTYLKENEALRGVINSGHERDFAFVGRCNMDTGEPENFSTWCPKAIALIGELPPTLQSRCLSIELKRKSQGEAVRKLRRGAYTDITQLGRKIQRWANDNGSKMEGVEVNLPNDRAEDNWEPLLAIAKLAGGGWYEKAVKVACNCRYGQQKAASSPTC